MFRDESVKGLQVFRKGFFGEKLWGKIRLLWNGLKSAGKGLASSLSGPFVPRWVTDTAESSAVAPLTDRVNLSPP